jgi:hypothetical protein
MAGAARGIASVERSGHIRRAKFDAAAAQDRVGRFQRKRKFGSEFCKR